MLLNARRILALFLLTAAAHAQDPSEAAPSGRNHVFFHPFITGVSLAVPELPFLATITYERDLASPGTSLIWQPTLTLGDREQDDIRVSQFGLTNLLGLRKYFKDAHRGFYVQGSGGFMFVNASAEDTESDEEASASAFGFGAFAFFGYRWSHVYLDIGGGYVTIDGSVEMDTGEEVELSASGPTIDGNLGFGF